MKKYIAGLLSALVFSATAQAEQITYNYTGYIGFINKYDNSQPWPQMVDSLQLTDGTISSLQTLHGQFSYDTATALQDGPDWGATYIGTAPQNSAWLTTDDGTVTFQSTTNEPRSAIEIDDNDVNLHDQFSLSNYAGARSLVFNFSSDNDSTLDGAGIPTDLSIFNRAPYVYFGGETADGNHFTAFTTITSMQRVSPIPEAQTWAMLFAGLGMLGWSLRQRKAG